MYVISRPVPYDQFKPSDHPLQYWGGERGWLPTTVDAEKFASKLAALSYCQHEWPRGEEDAIVIARLEDLPPWW